MGDKPSLENSALSLSSAGFPAVKSRIAKEDRVRSGEKAKRLQLVAHRGASRRQPHHGSRHHDAGKRDGPHELRWDRGLCVLKRRARNGDQEIDRNAFRVLGQVRERDQHVHAVAFAFAHADDAAAADLDARRTHMIERVEPLGEGPRSDDLAIIAFRGIDVVIVIIEARTLQALRIARA